MSYFDQVANTYIQGQGFTRQYSVTPMMADGVAIAALYGTATTTRTGDTTSLRGGTPSTFLSTSTHRTPIIDHHDRTTTGPIRPRPNAPDTRGKVAEHNAVIALRFRTAPLLRLSEQRQ